ncbi:MAG: GNAT family N-acetyltransferase [bacterium]|nr:GNAT family N-acetyltransferase [bacterium]
MAAETLTLSQPQPRLPELVDRACQSHDRFFITRDGHTDAVLLAAEEFEGLIETLEILSGCHKKVLCGKDRPHHMKMKEISMEAQSILIRDEKDTDYKAISDVTKSAFETMEISNHTEQFIIEALRSAKALMISLIAEADGLVVGHIAFSPVTMSDGTKDWYGLGPVSIRPDLQRQGIGKALIQEGLSRLRKLEAKGCCLVGHPEYYRQFGFNNVEGLVCEGVPREVFFALSFDGKMPRGNVMFHEGFKANGQQGAAADD